MQSKTAIPEVKIIRKPNAMVTISSVAVFSALIAISTILVIPFPPPLYEITWAPPIYMALSVLAGPWVSFASIAVGSFLGEAYNIAARGGPPIFIAGIVWARAPEALIIGWARKRGWKAIIVSMIAATIYETVAFFLPDWAFYSYGLFYGSGNTGIIPGFYAALPDLFTLVDLAYIPIALALIKAARPAFTRLGFD